MFCKCSSYFNKTCHFFKNLISDRHLEFRTKHALTGKRLKNHVIRIHDVTKTDFCGALCYMEPDCASYNFMKRSDTDGYKCELNNSTHEAHNYDLEENPNYVYRGTKVTWALSTAIRFRLNKQLFSPFAKKKKKKKKKRFHT